MGKPESADVMPPWRIVDCTCKRGCSKCDGDLWYYYNPKTGQHVSEMMRDAFDRHG